jgi:hypothetical protein
MSRLQSTFAATLKLASVDACTPVAMRNAGVPLRAALWFHCHGRSKGFKNATELTVFQMVRKRVGDARLAH